MEPIGPLSRVSVIQEVTMGVAMLMGMSVESVRFRNGQVLGPSCPCEPLGTAIVTTAGRPGNTAAAPEMSNTANQINARIRMSLK